eukprot:gene7538-15439_t
MHHAIYSYRWQIDWIERYIKLPEIAVMVDTSSGKSSLLSALSEVQLSSASELITRCPTRLHLEGTNNGTISVSVSIKWHQSLTYSSEFKARNFSGPDAFNHIPAAITKAQAFIIEKSGTPVAFDVVEVELKKPDSFDVTLIDLPGFVRSVGRGEDPRIVNDIKELCKEYLDNPRCIILAVIPANVDFHNSQIMADALEVNPSTCRTIPIINKPDLIDEGAEGRVLDLLLGHKTHKLSLGFHVAKCRGQKALDEGVDIRGGFEDERRFFRSTAPWKNLTDKSIMGEGNLGMKVADVQITMMSNAVPKIIQEVTLLRNEAEKGLQALGIDANSSDTVRRKIFSDFIERLKSEIRDNIQGAGSGTGLWRTSEGFTLRAHIQRLKKIFATDILAGRLNHTCTIKEGSAVTDTCPTTGSTCQGIVYKTEKKYCLVESIDTNDDLCFGNGRPVSLPIGRVGLKVGPPKYTKPAKISTVINNDSCIIQDLKEIKYMNVRSDFSRLGDLILKNNSRHLQVFLNADKITLDAYGKVAAKCAIDLFPKQIDKHLLDNLEKTIHESLHCTDAELKKVEAMNATEAAFQTFLKMSF